VNSTGFVSLYIYQVKLTVERLYGSLDSIQIRFNTEGDTATENVDFQQIDDGAINIDPKQMKSSIFIEVRSSMYGFVCVP